MSYKFKAVVIVDPQVDFTTGSLKNDEAIKKIPNIIKKIEQEVADWKKAIGTPDEYSLKFYITQDTHFDNYYETSEGKKLPVAHCIKGTEGWKVHPDVIKAVNEYASGVNLEFLEKHTFGSVDLPLKLADDLMSLSVKDTDMAVDFMGFCTDICVVSNAIIVKAYYPEAKISVYKDCCAGVTVESHEAALATMRSCQIEVV